MSDEEKTANYGILKIPYDTMLEAVQGRVVFINLPADFHAVAVSVEFISDCFLVKGKSVEFPPTKEGEMLPILPACMHALRTVPATESQPKTLIDVESIETWSAIEITEHANLSKNGH